MFNINRVTHRVDAVTRSRIQNQIDEIAAEQYGCRYSNEAADRYLNFFRQKLAIPEGHLAGKPFEPLPWHVEFGERFFGWVMFSEHYGLEVRRFDRGAVWIPKKNGKSPVLAGTLLYVGFGEGEKGNKVYSTARDGKQALRAHKLACDMALASDYFREKLKVTKDFIFDKASNSYAEVIAGRNVKSQHGHNGSLFVDETHVVDDELMTSLRGIAATRPSGMILQFSTAGFDTDGYGYKEWEYGKLVESGDSDNWRYYFRHWGIDPSAENIMTDEELWKKANPSWGFTIDPVEFRNHAEFARTSKEETDKFKTLRCNIWSNGADQWMDYENWKAISCDVPIESFKGCDCYVGLDLSRTRDFTAIVLTFFRDDKVYIYPFFHIPEERVKQLSQVQFSWRIWTQDKSVQVHEDEVIDLKHVKNHILELNKEYPIVKLGFDKLYAESVVQALEYEGVKCLPVAQNFTTFSPLISDFDSKVKLGQIRHSNNEILNWQARNARVDYDSSGNVKLYKKAQKGGYYTIDGIVSMLMSFAVRPSIEAGSDWIFEQSELKNFKI